MSEGNKCVVQVECFHANVKGSLGDLFESMRVLRQEGQPYKSALRFYDQNGKIAKLMEQYAAIEASHKHTIIGLSKAAPESKEQRAFISDADKWAYKSSMLYLEMTALVRSQLGLVVEAEGELAVELPDRFYRPARREECPLLLEHVKHASHLWIFVFHPAPLLQVDGLEAVGSMSLPLP